MASGTVIVGASGILAPLVGTLAARGESVLAVSRTGAPVPGADRHLGADATSPAGCAAIAAAGPYAAAVLYGPAVAGPRSAPRPELLAAVDGPAVLILTSDAADPARADDPARAADGRRPRPGDPVLLLGWARDDDGPSRWHTPEEVSAAALAALAGRRDGILGHVRPWPQRPGGAA